MGWNGQGGTNRKLQPQTHAEDEPIQEFQAQREAKGRKGCEVTVIHKELHVGRKHSLGTAPGLGLLVAKIGDAHFEVSLLTFLERPPD